MNYYLSIVFNFFLLFSIHAQDKSFTVEVSTDSILLGNTIEVVFSLKNQSGENFQAPDFENMEVVFGPNQSSSMSIINGEVSQEQTYSYYIKPTETGVFYILPANITVEDTIIETSPLEIIVYPNPDGLIQEIPRKSERNSFFGEPRFKIMPREKTPEKPKKKRKIYKM